MSMGTHEASHQNLSLVEELIRAVFDELSIACSMGVLGRQLYSVFKQSVIRRTSGRILRCFNLRLKLLSCRCVVLKASRCLERSTFYGERALGSAAGLWRVLSRVIRGRIAD